jgi:hypothetical protein
MTTKLQQSSTHTRGAKLVLWLKQEHTHKVESKTHDNIAPSLPKTSTFWHLNRAQQLTGHKILEIGNPVSTSISMSLSYRIITTASEAAQYNECDQCPNLDMMMEVKRWNSPDLQLKEVQTQQQTR